MSDGTHVAEAERVPEKQLTAICVDDMVRLSATMPNTAWKELCLRHPGLEEAVVRNTHASSTHDQCQCEHGTHGRSLWDPGDHSRDHSRAEPDDQNQKQGETVTSEQS